MTNLTCELKHGAGVTLPENLSTQLEGKCLLIDVPGIPYKVTLWIHDAKIANDPQPKKPQRDNEKVCALMYEALREIAKLPPLNPAPGKTEASAKDYARALYAYSIATNALDNVKEERLKQ